MPDPQLTHRRRRLVKAYGSAADSQSRSPADEDFADIAKKYAYLVHRWARRYAGTSSGVVDWEDLVSVGLMGLLQARMRYSPDSERPFRTYAEFRIKGAILDELRRIDPMSQPMRRKVRALSRAVDALAHELGRPPTEEELAKAMGVTLEKIQSMRKDTQELRFTEISHADQRSLRDDIQYSGWNRSELKVALAEAIASLDKRSQTILSLYYFEGLTMRELGEVVGLTEARVSQIHKATIVHLRGRLREQSDTD